MARNDEMIEVVKEKARTAHRLFSTTDGKALMQILKDEYELADLRGRDSNDTYYNLGARDVIKYLELLTRVGEKDV